MKATKWLLLWFLLSLTAEGLAEARSGYTFQSNDVQRMQDDDFRNPGMLWVDKGQQLFYQQAGTSKRACSDCHDDLSGTFLSMPSVNTHIGELVNLTTQIQHCRSEHQGADPISYESETALALTAWIGHQAKGQHFEAVPEALQSALSAGRDYFYRRKGQYNLGCHHCHERYVGHQLRGDLLSQGQSNPYPIYRLEWQTMGSLHRRFRSCDLGVRAQPPELGSEQYIQLELYLRERARTLAIETPGVRR